MLCLRQQYVFTNISHIASCCVLVSFLPNIVAKIFLVGRIGLADWIASIQNQYWI
jgi:hypothetical protein